MSKFQPLDELEMFDVLQAAYPEKFSDDNDETWDAALDFADNLQGFDNLAELLGRVVMLTMPMHSELSGLNSHCLGKVEVADGQVRMMAVVRRAVSASESGQ